MSVGTHAYEFKSCPFAKVESVPVSTTQPIKSDITKTIMLKTASDYSSGLKATAGFSYKGWGATVQASFSAAHNLSYKSEKAVLINHRIIEHGFEKFKGT